MTNTNEIKNFAKAFIEAQKEMGNAPKDNNNSYYKSKYADLNSIREACLPALNKHGIAVLQPIVQVDNKNYVKTLLLHESGESMECLTEIIFAKQNDAQAQGSGITYARRYGLQSLVNVGAEDDDGNKASEQPKKQPIKTIDEKQQKEIAKLIIQAKIPNFLEIMKIEKINDLPESRYNKVIQGLNKKIEENKNKNNQKIEEIKNKDNQKLEESNIVDNKDF